MKKRIVGRVAFGLGLFFVAVAAFESKPFLEASAEAKETLVCTDGEYYSEMTYVRTESENARDSLSSYLKGEKRAEAGDVRYEYVLGVEKKVFVAEGTDTYGNRTSKLLTKQEVEELDDSPNSSIRNSGCIGIENASKYSLTLKLWVWKGVDDNGELFYMPLGKAEWEDRAILPGTETAEEKSDDFMALTWGGGGQLVSETEEFVGEYYNNTSISASPKYSDSYQGFCWQFREKTWGFGSPMKLATASATLVKTYPTLQELKTNVKFTYIHTYKNIEFNLVVTPQYSVQIGADGATLTVGMASSIGLQQTEGNWQVEIDVPGVEY